MPAAIIANPRDLPIVDGRLRAIAELAVAVTVAPWTAKRPDLPDEDILHVVTLSAFFGHLNRIADAVAVPLDYAVELDPPHADPTVPALAPAPHEVGPPKIDLAKRPATTSALVAWRDYVFDRPARFDRGNVAAWVGHWLGCQPRGFGTTAAPSSRDAVIDLAETVTLAPWQLTDASYAPLRAQGYDDAALFDVCVSASTVGVIARIGVALAGM